MRRLKDKDLQKQLDELSGGSFSEELAKGVIKLHDDSGIPLMAVEFGHVVGKSMTRRFALAFEEGDIEDAPDYNPKTWNRYPDVTPPVGVWMRCEFVNRLNGEIERNVAKYIEEGNVGLWVDKRGDDVCNVDRFRPWED